MNRGKEEPQKARLDHRIGCEQLRVNFIGSYSGVDEQNGCGDNITCYGDNTFCNGNDSY